MRETIGVVLERPLLVRLSCHTLRETIGDVSRTCHFGWINVPHGTRDKRRWLWNPVLARSPCHTMRETIERPILARMPCHTMRKTIGQKKSKVVLARTPCDTCREPARTPGEILGTYVLVTFGSQMRKIACIWPICWTGGVGEG